MESTKPTLQVQRTRLTAAKPAGRTVPVWEVHGYNHKADVVYSALAVAKWLLVNQLRPESFMICRTRGWDLLRQSTTSMVLRLYLAMALLDSGEMLRDMFDSHPFK